MNDNSVVGFVGVHLGIGNSNTQWTKEGFDLIEKACDAGINELLKSNCARLAIVRTISVLENSSLTNAGFGSNLNQNGDVECDASIMDGNSGLYGCVGCLQEVSNPIAVAYDLLEQQKIPRPLGLLPPDFLTGEGARNFAMANGHLMRNLRSSKSIKRYRKYIKLLKESAEPKIHHEDQDGEEPQGDCVNDTELDISIVTEEIPYNKRMRLDTVGAIAIDSSGNVCVGSSSGGIALKYPGRVGSAARIGAGCWADEHVGVSSTGNGEYIGRTFLSKEVSNALSKNTIQSNIENIFVNNRLMNSIQKNDLIAGYIGAKFDPETSKITFICDIFGGNIFIGFKTVSGRFETEFLSCSNDKECFYSILI